MQPAALFILIAVLVAASAIVAAVVKYFLGGKKPRESGKLKKFHTRKGKKAVYDHIPLLPDGSSERVFAILSKKMAVRDSATGTKIANDFIEAGEYGVTNAYRSPTGDKLLADLQIESGVIKAVYVYNGAPLKFTLDTISSEEEGGEEPD